MLVSRVLAFAAVAGLAAACGSAPSKDESVPTQSAMGVAKLIPRNGSTVRGVISFTQRGERVAVAAQFFELYPGPHSLYIHQVGNCSSINAASAGPVWNVAGDARSGRTGDLPLVNAGTEGRAELQTTVSGLSVGTGRPNDVIGHSVVIHAAVDPDPKAVFGERNGWIACGVIQRSNAATLKDLL
jgi:Cu-Zn family superoxide dismutase